jgi:hypothetical protein
MFLADVKATIQVPDGALDALKGIIRVAGAFEILDGFLQSEMQGRYAVT